MTQRGSTFSGPIYVTVRKKEPNLQKQQLKKGQDELISCNNQSIKQIKPLRVIEQFLLQTFAEIVISSDEIKKQMVEKIKRF